MSKIINIQNIPSTNFELQNYTLADNALINQTIENTTFNPAGGEDYIEYFIYNTNNELLFSNVDGYPGYSLIDNNLILDPEKDLNLQGFLEGQYNTSYNFLKKKLASSATKRYYIEEISSDRTEIRLNTTQIPLEEVITSSLALAAEIQASSSFYQDFYLNFNNNQLVIANNCLLDSDNTVLIKLYEALPQEFAIKSECWVVETIAEPISYFIEIQEVFESQDQNVPLKGPNLNLNIKDQVNNSTNYYTYSSLLSSPFQQGSSSLQYQIDSILADKGIEINIDYSDYNNFIHFSSANTRLENFWYKLSLIEEYTYSASLSSGVAINSYITNNNNIWQLKIQDIIKNFDGYDHYLYYESGSTSWPKSTSVPPYDNVLSTSLIGQTWLTSQSAIAEEFDRFNKDALIGAIPGYLIEDSNNDKYTLFVEMLGQHFDNIWVYIKDITNKFNGDNRINYGISKDLVATAIRDMGVKIYQNNFSSNDLYLALLGITPSGSLLGLPYTTGSLPVPTYSGLQYVDTYITSSISGALQPTDDINKEIYKRIYHNLPYLLKKKGTVEGLRALITTYGIPDTILRINEFGGQNKIIENDYDNWEHKFNYAYTVTGSNYNIAQVSLNNVKIPWRALSVPSQQAPAVSIPGAIEFRFKTFGLPSSSIPYSQSILHNNNNTFTSDIFNIVLEYTGSGYETASYSGSPIDPDYQYATLKFYITSTGQSASIYLPFFDGEWWSILVNATTGSAYPVTGKVKYELYAKNKIYEGYDGNTLGYQGYDSFTSSFWWGTKTTQFIYLGGYSCTQSSHQYGPISASFQEFRYYTFPLSESAFNDYVMNPYSIEGNEISGAFNSASNRPVQTSRNTLLFRAPLGSELDNSGSGTQTRFSIHPAVTGSYPVTNSFSGATGSYDLINSYTFNVNREYIYLNQTPVGIKNPVSNKIRIEAELFPANSSSNPAYSVVPSFVANLPDQNVLSPYISIQQKQSDYTKDINYVEIAFSPQDEINNDIIDQFGYFNIGSYIGDPRDYFTTSSYYPDLNRLRDDYFLKYTHNYSIWDYIRLIEFYDNSLFKMIKDFTPARTSLASGLVIKQTILERQKYPTPQSTINTNIAFVGSPTTRAMNIKY